MILSGGPVGELSVSVAAVRVKMYIVTPAGAEGNGSRWQRLARDARNSVRRFITVEPSSFSAGHGFADD